MKTIAIHATAYKRVGITRIAWTALNRVREQFKAKGYDSFVVVGVTGQEHVDLATEFGFDHVRCQNKPVGLKFNLTAKEIMRRRGWDYFMEYCSDNILRDDYVDKAVEMLEQGHRYIAHNQFYICDMEKGKVLKFGNPNAKRGGISNVGRITHATIIRGVWRKTFMLYDVRINKRLDYFFLHHVKQYGSAWPEIIPSDTPLIVDLKDKDSMNPAANFERHPGRFPLTNIVGNFPELPAEFQRSENTSISWQQQEKSEVIPSEFTSQQVKATAPSQATPSEPSEAPESATPSATRQRKRKRSSSSQQQPAAASQEAATSSTRPRKTTTDGAKS